MEALTTGKKFIQADTRKTTSLVKKYLKEKFNINTTVRTSKYSGGSSLNIEYPLGVDAKVVEKDVKRLQHGSFDGMQDLYEYHNHAETGLVIDGYELETFRYVFVRQEFPDGFLYKVAKFISDNTQFADIPALTSKDGLHSYFKELFAGCWNWYELAYKLLRTRNFASQDENKIDFFSIDWVKGESWSVEIIYTFNGSKYTTAKPANISEPSVKKASAPEKNSIQVVDYSEKSFAVIGNSYEIREELAAAGGIYNKFLKCGPGWIFSNKHRDEVNNIIIEYHQKTK